MSNKHSTRSAKQPTKLRVGDKVVVISGAHKGQSGAITRFTKARSRVFVEGVNKVKRHVKPQPAIGQAGGVVEKDASLAISNVALVAGEGQRTRLGYKILEDGQKVRIAKATGEQV